MKNNCDILNLEWASIGRDVDIVEPVLVALEQRYNLKVVRESIWLGELKILKYKPKMILISNSMGAVINFRIVKLAKKLGIKVVSLISEGDCFYSEESTLLNFWGWNTDHTCYEDLTLYWSETIKERALSLDGVENYNIKVSGATGFDRYRFWEYSTKDEFLKKYGKSEYNKVVGISAYTFDVFEGYGAALDKEGNITYGEVPSHAKAIMEYREPLQEIYEEIVKSNPDILFVVKLHPVVTRPDLTDCSKILREPNVLVIHKEENIADVINSMDLWLAFESTSVMEAWLLGKNTISLKPLSLNFARSEIHNGSYEVATVSELEAAIEEFYNEGFCKGFEQKEYQRNRIITDIIGYGDGKNHMRAAEFVYEIFSNNKPTKRCIDRFVINVFLKECLRFFILKTPAIFFAPRGVKLYIDNSRQYVKNQRSQITEEYRRLLKEFDNGKA